MPIPGLFSPPTTAGTLSPFSLLPGRQVQLGNLTFNYVDASGVEWRLTSMQGWFDEPDNAAVQTQRTAAHGSYQTSTWMPGRTVTLNLVLRGPDIPTLETALNSIGPDAPFTETSPLIVPGNPWTFAYFRRSGVITKTMQGVWADVTLVLFASDPRRYVYTAQPILGSLGGPEPGLTLPLTLPATLPSWTPGGAVAGTLVGNFNAPWLAQINGYVVNPILTNNLTGDYLALNLTVNDGDYVVVDSLEKTVLYNGVTDRSGTILSGSRFFSLAPGAWSVQYTGTAGDNTHAVSSLQFLARDCYS